jgi:hypothetical protein
MSVPGADLRSTAVNNAGLAGFQEGEAVNIAGLQHTSPLTGAFFCLQIVINVKFVKNPIDKNDRIIHY